MRNGLYPRWSEVIRDWKFVLAMACGILLAITAIVLILPPFLEVIEARTGHRIYDPVLALIGPVYISEWIFVATYSVSLLGVLRNIRSPHHVLWIVFAYAGINLFRMITMTVVPLEPPETIMALRDPFLEGGVYAGAPKIKDLFFSGHTATVGMFIFMEREARWRLAFISGTILVAFLLLWQHVHYTIDVLAAPFFSFFCVWAIRQVMALLFPASPVFVPSEVVSRKGRRSGL
ncbi:MAG TPA: phosphatase PAP2-related protein [Rhodothermales bacterium]|nr:hypothetical protein [Bacteroidota bacterium]HRK74955.1 phosphatase PAP2-related protein [Rhodothermales bacterium]HRR09321.1 phosphatase PAP2-related protein [Rhodothermales bacterium]